jgi:hypothetical protein
MRDAHQHIPHGKIAVLQFRDSRRDTPGDLFEQQPGKRHGRTMTQARGESMFSFSLHLAAPPAPRINLPTIF